jgi:hypothetical protein
LKKKKPLKKPKYFKEKSGFDSAKEKQILWIIVIILALAIFALLFLISVGTVNLFEQPKSAEEQREEKEDRKKWLLHRKARLETVIHKKRGLQRSLDRYVTISRVIMRILILLLVVTYNFAVHYFGNANKFTEYVSWNTSAFAAISFLFFVVSNKQRNFWIVRDQLDTMLKIWIYGKFLNIDTDVAKGENELIAIELEIVELDKTLLPPSNN